MMESTYEQVNEILEDFPFNGSKNRQQEKLLSRYLVVAPGSNKSQTAEELGVTRQTVYNIEDAWSQLTDRQRLVLIEYLRREYQNHFQVDNGEVTA